ncbi:MAG: heparinase II/III family protein [Paludibacter sp.]|nr:heparinase II/III family protein [Paludibacter sp.]MDD4427733.1 heparinase II/III family protein [Paludibacter sp.]
MKHILPALLVSLSILLINISNLPAQAMPDVKWQTIDGVYMPVPPKIHPRLYLRAEHVAGLSERIKDPVLKKVWSDLQKLRQDRTPEEIPETKDWRFYFDTKGLLTRVELSALDYLMTNDSTYARAAIDMIADTLETAIYPHISDISRAIGRLMVSGSIVYDWCYDQLTPAEKTRFVNAFVRLAKMLECGYPPVKDNSIVGHASEWMIMRDLISTGIAIYDEYPEMYHLAAGRFFREHLPARNWFYPGQAYHQGMSYLNVRFSNDLFALWIFDRMGVGNVYHPAQQYILYDMIYKRRPDGQIMPGGDVNYTRKRQATYSLPSLLAGSYYKDEYINYEYMRDPRVDNHSKIFELLWRDTKLGVRKPDDLPLTRYSGFPFGWMIARTGWGTESVIAEMKINEYNFLNHQHHDAGAFQLYYKGPLAIDAGTYQGSSGGYNSLHNKNFFKRTIAHNSLLIYDPDEKFPASGYGGADKSDFVTNEGGQRLPNNWRPAATLDELLSGNFKTGEVLAKSFGPDSVKPEYSHLKGDITQAYSSKVKEVKRSFVFLNLKRTDMPATLIVFDKIVSANAGFKKTWLLHSIEQPEIKGNRITIGRTKDGDSGVLVNTMLLPNKDNAKITPVGGKGKEFWVSGVNYPNEPRDGQDEANERGAWRVEVSPLRASTEDYYLNVMQVTDAKQKMICDVKRIEGDKIIGVQLADRVVTFSKNMNLISSDYKLKVTGNNTFKFVITDMEQGLWQVSKNGKVYIKSLTVQKGEHVLHFSGKKGTYRFVRLK